MSNSGQSVGMKHGLQMYVPDLKKSTNKQVLCPKQQKTFHGKSGQQKTSSQKKKKKNHYKCEQPILNEEWHIYFAVLFTYNS